MACVHINAASVWAALRTLDSTTHVWAPSFRCDWPLRTIWATAGWCLRTRYHQNGTRPGTNLLVAVDGDSWKAGARGSAWPIPCPTARSTRAGYLCCDFCALARCRGPSPRSPGGTRHSPVAGATCPTGSFVQELRASAAGTHSYRLRPLVLFLRHPASKFPPFGRRANDRGLPLM